MAPRMTENNAYAKFWADKERALWHVMVISVVVYSRTKKTTTTTWLHIFAVAKVASKT